MTDEGLLMGALSERDAERIEHAEERRLGATPRTWSGSTSAERSS